MVKINLSVVLDNETAVFYPEQVVSGRVHLNINDDLKVSAINVTLKGHARVRWSEGSGEHRRTYSAYETYIKDKICLHVPPSGESSTVLRASTYEYPFQYKLPKQLPSSYEADIGFVRYQVKAHVDRPWSFDSYSKRVFTLVNLLDLNTLPDIQRPAKLEKSKQLCCWCCASNPIVATMEVKNRIGYVPGETIEFSSEIANGSSRNMKESVGKLIMYVQYHATSKTRSVENVLTTTKQGPIEPGGTDSWRSGKLQIPSVPPSFLSYCNIIDIRYYAQMTVVPKGPSFSLKVPVEVVIGSIPLKQVADQYNLPTSAPTTLAAPMGLYTDTNMPANMPHATFAESAFGRKSMKEDKDNEHTSGDTDFAPVYAYYTWDRSDPTSNFTAKS